MVINVEHPLTRLSSDSLEADHAQWTEAFNMTAGDTLGEAVSEEGGIRKAACISEETTELLVLHREHFGETSDILMNIKIRLRSFRE